MKLLNLSGGGILAMLGVMLYDTYVPTGCDTDVPDHLCSNCPVPEKGRIRSVALIARDFAFNDPSDPTEWQAGIDARKIIIVPNTHGLFDGGAEVLGPGYGDQVQRLNGYNFKLTFFDPSYFQNGDFYNALKHSQNYYFAYRTENLTHIVLPIIQAIPKNPVTDSITDEVTWVVDVIWAGSDLPVPYTTPAGIFSCFAYSN